MRKPKTLWAVWIESMKQYYRTVDAGIVCYWQKNQAKKIADEFSHANARVVKLKITFKPTMPEEQQS